jgi:DNA/RNA endonuclease YhcR with UshA esterase domain
MKLTFFWSIFFLFKSFCLYSQEIALEEVGKYLGKDDTVKVCGKIYNVQVLKTKKGSNITLLNLGAKYPEQLLTVVIYDETLSKLSPEVQLVKDKDVCITGNIVAYKGKPEIVINNPGQFVTQTRLTVKKLPEKKTNITGTSAVEKKEIVAQSSSSRKKQKAEGVTQSVKLKKEIILRSGPSTDFPIITVVPSGSALSVIYSNNGWSYVTLEAGSKKAQKIKGYTKDVTGN